MVRFLFRFLSMVTLAIAVVMSVLDATRSIAASGPVLTPLADSWRSASPGTLAAAQSAFEQSLAPELWAMAATPVLALPGFVVFAALALLFYIIGRKPERRSRRFASES